MFSVIGNWAHNKFLYLSWLLVGKSSFLPNIVEEIRPGCRNLQRFLIMIYLSEIFLDEMLKFHSLVCGFKNMDWSRISSIDIDYRCRPVRICFCLESARPWSELELISISTAWDLSRKHWWDLITFEYVLFLYSLIVCLCLKCLVLSSKWRVELGVWKVVFFPFPGEIVFFFFCNFLSDIFWNSINFAYVSQLGEEYLV